jgi:hypothetical protein
MAWVENTNPQKVNPNTSGIRINPIRTVRQNPLRRFLRTGWVGGEMSMLSYDGPGANAVEPA